MAKHRFNQIWIDGFNLFHKWHRTLQLFKGKTDIKYAQDESIRLLAAALGRKRKQCTVFMDGGLSRSESTLQNLRIRFPGSGKKADTLILEYARAKTSNQRTLAVTSDRALAATLRQHRIQIIDSEKFIKEFLVGTPAPDTYNYTETKPEVLSADEVEEWLKIFSDDSE